MSEYNVPDDWRISYSFCSVCRGAIHSSGCVNDCVCTEEEIDRHELELARDRRKAVESVRRCAIAFGDSVRTDDESKQDRETTTSA